MANEYIHHPDLVSGEQYGFTQVVKSSGSRILHISGQVAWLPDLSFVGVGDLGAQTKKALENLGKALAAAAATPRDVAHIRVYLPDYSPERCLPAITPHIKAFFGEGHYPANTTLGVEKLAFPELLIEIEAVAVVD
jgi:enamine deaminase RidA (YjgF/YER057c/UK114 family)